MLSHDPNAASKDEALEDGGNTMGISLKLNENCKVIILDRTNSCGVRSASIYKYYMKRRQKEAKSSDLEDGIGGGGEKRGEVNNEVVKDDEDNKDDKEYKGDEEDKDDEDDEFGDQIKIDELIDEIRLQAIKVITICLIFVVIAIVTGYNIYQYVWKAHIKY